MFQVKSNAVRTGIESVKIPCRNGLTFTEGNQIIFDVPRDLGFGQLKDAFIECDVNLNGSDNAPLAQLYRNIGGSSLIERLTIRADTGQVIEQLDNYNLYTNMKYLASEDLGILDKRSRMEGCARSYKIQDNPYVTQNAICAAGANLTNTNDNWRFVDRKLQIPLNSSGVFNNRQVHPCLAVPLQVNILLEKNERALFVDPDYEFYNCAAEAGGAPIATITLSDNANLKFGVKGAGNQSPTDPLLNKISNLNLRVGQRVKVGVDLASAANLINNGDAEISAIGLDAAGQIVLTFPANILAGNATGITVRTLNSGKLFNDTASGAGLTATPQSYNYQIKNPRLVIPKVIPAPQYTAAIAKAIAKGKYGMDIISYIDYQNAIPGSVTSSTTIVPADLSRCKSLLSVPTEQVDYDRYDRLNNIQGKYMGASSYEYQINNVLRPSRLVKLEREAHGQFVRGGNYIGNPDWANPSCLGGTHMYEVEKALSDAGISIRNLGFLGKTADTTKLYDGCWLTGRSLGPYGMSENLMGVSAIQYLNYDGTNANLKLLHSFVVHIRTIAISPQGIEIRY